MFVLLRTHYAAATDSVLRQVHCEKCGSDYEYVLVRRGDAAHTQASGAQKYTERAKSAAAKSLHKRLARDIDPVRCPDCNWLQSDMIREVRRRRFRFLIKLSWGLAILAALDFACACLAEQRLPFRDGEWEPLLYLVALPLLLAILIPFARAALLRTIHPNTTGESFPDAPPAMKNQRPCHSTRAAPDATGNALNYERPAPQILPGGWITVQLRSAKSPPVCCECLQPTNRIYTLHPAQVATLSLFLCPDCHKRSFRRAAVCIANTILILFATFSYLAITNEKNHEPLTAKLMISAFAALILGGGIGALLSKHFTPSARVRNFARDRNTTLLRFRNRAFTPTYADANAI